MPGSMSRDDLVSDLKATLHDAAGVFNAAADADFKRMLDVAALDMGRVRPRTLLGSVTLTADQDAYDAPAGILAFKSMLWGINAPNPWDERYPGRLPNVYVVEDSGVRKLSFAPAPTALQIAVLGSTFKFYYYGGHQIDDTAANTTIQSGDRGLLLLRAQAEACKELSLRNINKPIALRDSVSMSPRNGTPSYLFETLMKQFEEISL